MDRDKACRMGTPPERFRVSAEEPSKEISTYRPILSLAAPTQTHNLGLFARSWPRDGTQRQDKRDERREFRHARDNDKAGNRDIVEHAHERASGKPGDAV